jgi:hypothetical protein
MRVEHHLLGLARVGTHKQHPAVTQTHVRNLHRHRRAIEALVRRIGKRRPLHQAS